MSNSISSSTTRRLRVQSNDRWPRTPRGGLREGGWLRVKNRCSPRAAESPKSKGGELPPWFLLCGGHLVTPPEYRACKVGPWRASLGACKRHPTKPRRVEFVQPVDGELEQLGRGGIVGCESHELGVLVSADLSCLGHAVIKLSKRLLHDSDPDIGVGQLLLELLNRILMTRNRLRERLRVIFRLVEILQAVRFLAVVVTLLRSAKPPSPRSWR